MIKQVSYQEAMQGFKHIYRMEKLPYTPIKNATWFADADISCAALVRASSSKARIKGTVVAPEMRGQGYGEQMLLHLIGQAKQDNYKTIEVFTRQKGWYINNGFLVDRSTKWGAAVLSRLL